MGIDYLIFGDVDSRDYGIEVFFKDVDRTPKRVYQRIEVPGRNGAILIDEKRYEDVPVSYDCIALLDADRKAFVNALAAQTGYQRMQDSFNDDEFYSAVFEGDVDPNVTKDRAQSTFTIKFTRSAQRYLISGETELTLESGDTLTNPTLFESSPLLVVEGYGNIGFNDYTIEIEDIVVGDVPIASAQTFNNTNVSREWSDKADMFSSGDQITIGSITLRSSMTITTNAVFQADQALDDRPMGLIYWNSPNTDAGLSFTFSGSKPDTVNFAMVIPQITLTVGTNLKKTYITRATVKVDVNGTWQRQSWYATTTIDYKNGKIKITAERLFSDEGSLPIAGPITQNSISLGAIKGYSSTRIEVGTKVIDCELGEAYLLDGDATINLNQHIDLGSDLPKLASGINTINYDNTITGLKVTPRWWEA